MHRVLIGQFGTVARMGLREILDGQGIEVVAEAESAEGIVSCVSEVRPDVVVLDLAMPLMDGLQAAPSIREYAPAARILVLSGFDHSRMAARAREQGADGYLEKGTAFSEIADVLIGLCREDRAPGRDAAAR